MFKLLIIARREYNAAVKTKSFLISLLVMPLLMAGSVLVQVLLKDQVDTQEKRFAIVDRTPGEQLFPTLDAAAAGRNARDTVNSETGKRVRPVFAIEHIVPSQDTPEAVDRQRFDLSERVRRGEMFGFLDIGPGVCEYLPDVAESTRASAANDPNSDQNLDRTLVRYHSNSPTYDDFQRWAEPILQEAVKERRFKAAGLESAVVRSVLKPVPVVAKGLSQKDAETGEIREAKDENKIASVLAPAGLMVLMFMLILVGGTPAMQGVVEEKMQKISEMLLGSVRPFELMMGKLIGLMGVSLTLAALYLGGAYWAARHYGMADMISPAVMAWFVVYLVVAVLMYGALFIAVGAACSDIRETQTMLWPVMLVAMLPLFVWINVAKEPSSTFSTVISLVPTATPMLMIIRLAVPPGIGWWQPALGLVLMLGTMFVLVYIAGRIFRIGILMQGKGANLRDLARWIVRG